MDLMAARRAIIGAACGIAYEAWNLSFDGSSYIDTGLYLFTQENINKDFELEITNLRGSVMMEKDTETIICAKHNGNAYGFLVRLNSRPTTYAGTICMRANYDNHVVIRRIDGVISVEGEVFTNGQAIRVVNQTHQWPLVLGCAVDDDGSFYRFARGTIGHIVVRWI